MQVQSGSSIIQRFDTHAVGNAKALNRSVATGELASTPNRNSGSSRRYVPLRRAASGCTAQIRAYKAPKVRAGRREPDLR